MSILVAQITAELSRFYEYYDSIDKLRLPPDTKKIPIHSSNSARNRNIVIHTALVQNSYSHIFFTDDDHVYPPETIWALLQRDVDIVSGAYTMKFHPFPVVAFEGVNEQGLSKFLDMRNVSPDELKEVDAVGAGCLLVRTEVFRRITYPWFALGQIWPDTWGEDLYFCKRAKEAGYKVYLDASVRVGHITKCVLYPDYKDGEWLTRYDINDEYSVINNGVNAEFETLANIPNKAIAQDDAG